MIEDVNPEVLRLAIEDQWDRGVDMFGKGQVRAFDTVDNKLISTHDGERHKAIRLIFEAGKLKTGSDFSYASLIMQHSSQPSDLMMAHIFSLEAVSLGTHERWMVASTMDRYLLSMSMPQIFGTQFHKVDGVWTMEPYDKAIISDTERQLWCVEDVSAQQRTLEQYQQGRGQPSTASCR